MTSNTRSIIQKLAGNPKQLFLIDGIGAILTAFFLGIILARFEDIFRMPQTVFCSLSLVACLYAAYSICCYFFVSNNWRLYLGIIIVANLLYGLVTIGLLIYYRQHITIPGLAYFILELTIISGLLFVEWKVLTSKASAGQTPTN